MTKELERVKQDQDFLIDHLHQRLHEQQLATEQYTAQLHHHEEVPQTLSGAQSCSMAHTCRSHANCCHMH